MKDELLWGAAWLHKATRSISYLNFIQTNGRTLGVDENDNTFSWDNKHAGAKILLSKVPKSFPPHSISLIQHQSETDFDLISTGFSSSKGSIFT